MQQRRLQKWRNWRLSSGVCSYKLQFIQQWEFCCVFRNPFCLVILNELAQFLLINLRFLWIIDLICGFFYFFFLDFCNFIFFKLIFFGNNFIDFKFWIEDFCFRNYSYFCWQSFKMTTFSSQVKPQLIIAYYAFFCFGCNFALKVGILEKIDFHKSLNNREIWIVLIAHSYPYFTA